VLAQLSLLTFGAYYVMQTGTPIAVQHTPSTAALCLLSSYCFFFAQSPLSSPLLYFADDEIVQVHTLYGI